MSIMIEGGKSYRAADGRKIGDLEWHAQHSCFYGDDETEAPGGGFRRAYRPNGRHGSDIIPRIPSLDLVAEWTDEPTGPVITETVKRIVPGYYGPVEVSAVIGDRVGVRISNLHGPGGPEIPMNASELRAAARCFAEMADALDPEAA